MPLLFLQRHRPSYTLQSTATNRLQKTYAIAAMAAWIIMTITRIMHVTRKNIICWIMRVVFGTRMKLHYIKDVNTEPILGDPVADSGGEGKSKRAGKYGTTKSKERREEPLGTMSYQTSSKRSPPFWLLIGQKNTKVFWHQSEARTTATVWNWSGNTLSPGAPLAVLYFSSSCHIFPPV